MYYGMHGSARLCKVLSDNVLEMLKFYLGLYKTRCYNQELK